MKVLVLVCLLIASAVAGKFKTAVVDCGGEVEGDKDVRKLVLEHDADVHELGKIMFCVYKKTGVQNESGDIDVDVLKSDVDDIVKDPTKAKELLEECKDSTGETPETKAFHLMKCIQSAL